MKAIDQRFREAEQCDFPQLDPAYKPWKGLLWLCVAALATIAGVAVAVAEEKPFAIETPIHMMQTVLCDKEVQARAILEAQGQSFHKGLMAYHALKKTKNERNEPSCAYVPPMRPVTVVIKRTAYGPHTVIGRTGQTSEQYILEVTYVSVKTNSEVSGFIMADRPAAKAGLSI